MQTGIRTDPRSRSSQILDGRDRAAARAMLKSIGYTDEDLSKPIVGVAHTWIETMPCTFNQRRLAERVKEGIREAGGTPMEYNTVAISDGVTMGTEGMKTSLVSRDLIADSIELVGRGTCSTPWSLSSAATRPSPAARWRSPGSAFRGW
jgi:dihydroxy-acid dehydratase